MVASCLVVLRLSVAIQNRLVRDGEKVNNGIDQKLEVYQEHVGRTEQDLS